LAFGKRNNLIDCLMGLEETLLNLPLERCQRGPIAWNKNAPFARGRLRPLRMVMGLQVITRLYLAFIRSAQALLCSVARLPA
jgi:hypothetical protein